MNCNAERIGVAVLGSTGSVGQNTLSVLSALKDRFKVVALAAGSNQKTLQQQIDWLHPRYASIDTNGAQLRDVNQVSGTTKLEELSTLDEIGIVVVASSGHAAISATIAALKAGKIVALANKEAVIAAGSIVMPLAKNGPGELRPVDSEHSAIWQCLEGQRFNSDTMHRIILTASGGPFRGWTTEALADVSPERALNHPTWSMGSKITIDSATLMNKGFELIEAHWLFDCPMDQLEILVHPQSIVHSMVEYKDGSLIAQLASHDMRLPIQYALTYPDRPVGPAKKLDLSDFSRLDFEPPDFGTFPMIDIARDCVKSGSTYPTVLSASDTVAVQAFLDGRISFLEICSIVQATLDAHVATDQMLDIDAILQADRWATEYAGDLTRMRTDV